MYSIVSVILNAPAPVELVITQFGDQANKRYIGITIPRSFALSVGVLFTWVMQLANGVQFLDITCLFLLSVLCAAASAPAQ